MGKETVLPKNIRQIGDIQGKEKICIEDYVMTYIRKKEQQEEKGYLGIFLGEQQQTEDSVYVFIRGILEVPTEIQEGQEQELLQKAYQEYFPDWEIQGCCVIGVYPTERMKKLSSFASEAGKFIYHLQEQEETLYWMESGQYERIRGYFVFYEQNRQMQEYLAAVFKDDRVEKESVPDKAIKSFRAKVKEKGEKKNTSFLRLASSFFVITVLAVGAIVVNRIDEIRNVQKMTDQSSSILGNELTEKEYVTDVSGTNVYGTAGTGGNSTASGASQGGTVVAGSGDSLLESILNQEDGELKGADAFWTEDSLSEGAEASGQEVTASSSGDESASAGETAASANGDGSSSSDVAVSTDGAAGAASADGVSAAGAASTSGTTAADPASANGTSAIDSASANGAAAAGTDASQAVDTDAATDSVSTAGTSAASDQTLAGTDTSAQAQEAAVRQTRAAYVIREGDTLADICSRYYGGLDRLEDICEVNGITDANMILPGQKIVLP